MNRLGVLRRPGPREGLPLALLAILGLCLGAPTARADAILLTGPDVTLDFNSLADGASNKSVQNYINGVLAGSWPGQSVKVSGAAGEANYTGDNHVVGPVVGGKVQPITLGPDTFLVNEGSDRIVMVFELPIFEVSFNYQIFPDGTAPDGTQINPTHPNWPDFSFVADGQLVFRTLGVMPGTNGTHSFSPASGTKTPELAPQFLGRSGTLSFPTGVRTLEFVDWPRMIGLDDLRISGQTLSSPVPEPASLVVLAAGLAGLVVARRRLCRAA